MGRHRRTGTVWATPEIIEDILMSRRDIVVIATSMGGVAALCRVVGTLGAGFPGTLLAVQHTAPSSPACLDRILRRHTSIPVSYAVAGEVMKRGHFYLAPPKCHLVVSSRGTLALDDGPRVNFVRPAGDPLFASAASVFGPRVVGVVLTGCDGDGAEGLRAIKRAGGVSVVQHPGQAEAPDMPMHALNHDSPDYAVSITELGPLLYALAQGRDPHAHNG